MTFDPAFGYGHVYVLKEALERAGSTDRDQDRRRAALDEDRIRPAVAALNGTVQFDARGMRESIRRRSLLQWQNGVPVVRLSAGCRDRRPLKATP